MKVLKYPDPFLRKKMKPVSTFDDQLRSEIKQMFEVMAKQGGIGLAASQVGLDKQIIVLCVPQVPGEEARPYHNKMIALVNPSIVAMVGKSKLPEGCLSFPGIFENIDRFAQVHLQAQNEQGEPIEIQADGLMAVAIQHEMDHLEGILFLDRMSRLKKSLVAKKMRKQ